MKKTLLFVLCLMTLAVFAAGCFNNDEADDAATVAPVATAEPTAEVTMEVPAADATAEPAGEDAADDAAAGEAADDTNVTEEGGEETTPDETTGADS